MLHTLEFSLPELLERVRAGQIPMSAQARVTYDDAALLTSQPVAHTVVTPPASQTTSDQTTAELFAQWEQEDAQATPTQHAENARIYAEIETNGIPRTRL